MILVARKLFFEKICEGNQKQTLDENRNTLKHLLRMHPTNTQMKMEVRRCLSEILIATLKYVHHQKENNHLEKLLREETVLWLV